MWEHDGIHTHHRPPPSSSLSLQQQEELDQQLMSVSPDTAPYALRTGTSAPNSIPLYKISSALSKPGTARYHITRSRQELGLTGTGSGGLGFLASLSQLQAKFKESWIIDSKMHGPTFVVLQNGFMYMTLERAVQEWIRSDQEGEDSSVIGREGVITDADEKVVRDGVLVGSCVFCPALNTYVVIQYTWMSKVDTDHYRVHFRHLFQVIHRIAGDKFTRRLLFNVSSSMII